MQAENRESSSSLLITRLFWVLSFASVILFAVFRNPGFLDYPNHLARFYVMTRDFHTPFYDAHYQDNFKLLPNVGVDAIMLLVGRIVPADIGLKLVVGSSILLYCLGYFRLHRQKFGTTLSPLILLIPMTAYSYSLFLGFLNFFLGSSLLPWAYLALSSRRGSWKWGVALGLWALVLFYCHFFCLLIFLFLAGFTLWFDSERQTTRTEKLIFVGISVGVLVLYKLSPTSGEQSKIVFSTVASKFKYFFAPFVFGPFWKVASVSFYLGVAFLLATRKAELKGFGLKLALAILGLFLVCPFGLQISGNFDGRIPSILFAFFAVFATWQVSDRKWYTIGVAALVTIHFATVGLAMYRTNQEGEKVAKILESVPAGASLASLTLNGEGSSHRDTWYPNFNMIQFSAVPQTPMHVHGIFSYKSQQPVLIKSALDHALVTPDTNQFAPLAQRLDEYERWRKGVGAALAPLGISDLYVLVIDHHSDGIQFVTPTTALYDKVVYHDQTYTLIRCDLSTR